MTVLRTLRLALTLGSRSRGRLVLLSVLLALAVNIFVVVQALSRASAESLDTALAADAGVRGTYNVSVTQDAAAVPSVDLAPTLTEVATREGGTDVALFEMYQGLDLDCPGGGSFQDWTVGLPVAGTGAPTSAPVPSSPVEAPGCLSGIPFVSGAVSISTAPPSRGWRETYFVEPALGPLVRATAPASEIRMTLRGADPSRDISRGLAAELQRSLASDPAWKLAGLRATVTRLDTGDATRRAADGVRWLYSAIGWAILIVGGLGILVAELLVLRDRSWFFGLSRATGAGRRHVACLVLGDVLLVVGLGMGLALLGARLAQPWVRQFSERQFGIAMDVLDPAVGLQLALGTLAVLAIATLYPMLRAIRLDPLDILESR